MKYLSVCSGIEAASCAWEPLGFEPVAFAEIESFPCAVLASRFPHVPNLGDMTQIDGSRYRGIVDILVGGTPCQAFSVAGQRNSLEDARGQLTLKFVELADAINPDFIVWENVPGVLNTRDNAFGCFLGALSGSGQAILPPGGRWANAGAVSGPKRAAAWRVLDAQYFGVAQRRRRVFVVASPGDRADPCEILFEFNGLRRDTAPCRKAGEEAAQAAGRSPEIRGSRIRRFQSSHWEGGPHPCLCTGGKGGSIGMSDQELFNQRGTGLVGSASCPPDSGYIPDIVSQAISCKWAKGSSGPAGDEHHNLVSQSAPASISKVRRLTPTECERLQGFPDGWTDVPFRGKPATDSVRYKAIGNSMAVPVMHWIGMRIKTKQSTSETMEIRQ